MINIYETTTKYMIESPTAYLFAEPRESLARQLLLGSTIGECIGYRYIGIVFVDGTLHR